MKKRTIAIVGGGISGLVCALRLQQRGLTATIYESADRVGGPIHTVDHDGYLVESGPHTLLERTRSLGRFIDELGLRPDRIEASTAAKKRFVVRDGRPVALPSSPGSFLTTPLLSTAAKLRLLAEPFVSRHDLDIDESLASFVERRLGPEVLNYAVDPFVGGTYSGDPHHLSVKHCFPFLNDLEEARGSITAGMIDRIISNKRQTNRAPTTIISFRDGLKSMIDALESRLMDSIRLNTPVEAATRHNGKWKLTYRKKGRKTSALHDAIVFTAPGHALARLKVTDADANPVGFETFAELVYPPIVRLAMGFRRQDVAHPLDGLGLLVPSVENFHILGTLFNSTMFPERAPHGHVNLTTFIGGARRPELAGEDDETLIEIARLDLHRLLGVSNTPTFLHLQRYERGIPQYEVGYSHYMNHFDDIERRHPGLFFAGNARDGIAVPAVIDAAEDHAHKISFYLDEQLHA